MRIIFMSFPKCFESRPEGVLLTLERGDLMFDEHTLYLLDFFQFFGPQLDAKAVIQISDP